MNGFALLLFITCIFLMGPNAQAETSMDIEVAKATVVSKLNDQVVEAIGKLKFLTDSIERKEEEQSLAEAQTALDKAVKAAYGGSTEDGVKRAKEVLEWDKRVQDLDAIAKAIPPGDENTTKAVIEEALKNAKVGLEKTVSNASETSKLQEIADKRFAGFNFGVALGLVAKAGKRDLVQSASLDANGIVRIDRDNNTSANLILESHYFFTPNKSFIGLVDARNWGFGPFIAVQPGTDVIIQSVGCGLMVGFKRSSIIAQDLARDRGDSFNIGIGMMINPNAKVLGDGIQKNQPLPAGETSVRLRTTTEAGWLVTFSYSF